MHAPPTSVGVFFFSRLGKGSAKVLCFPTCSWQRERKPHLWKFVKSGNKSWIQSWNIIMCEIENTAVVHLHVALMWSYMNIPSFYSLIFFSINCCEVYWTGSIYSENCCLHWTEPSIMLTHQMASCLLHTLDTGYNKLGKGTLQKSRHFLKDLLSSFKVMPFCKTLKLLNRYQWQLPHSGSPAGMHFSNDSFFRAGGRVTIAIEWAPV